MSRSIHRAPLAVTTDRAVLLNLAELDVHATPDAVVREALAQRGEIFVGVVLTPTEVAHVVDQGARILPNITGPMAARRIRRRARARRPPRR